MGSNAVETEFYCLQLLELRLCHGLGSINYTLKKEYYHVKTSNGTIIIVSNKCLMLANKLHAVIVI